MQTEWLMQKPNPIIVEGFGANSTVNIVVGYKKERETKFTHKDDEV